MNRGKLLVLIVGVFLLGGALGFWIANSGAMGGAPTSASASSASSEGRRVLYWHDPMVPNVRFDKPGKSPYMDMQLVPVYADEGPRGADVRINPAMSQALGIRLGKVERVAMQPKLSAVGSVVFDETLLEVVQARVEGYVTRLHVKAPLEHVRRGQALAEVLSPQWRAAQEEYLALLGAQSERGRAIREAARARLVVLGVPEMSILTLEKERKSNPTTTVVAPRDGVITDLSIREGSAFAPGAPLFRLNDLRKVWVNAQVPESQLSLLAVGSEVNVRATAFPGEEFPGRVAARLPEVDAQTRTGTARISVENPEEKLAPGMFVSIDVTGGSAEPQLVVPTEAIIVTGERSIVIVAKEAGTFDAVDVSTGLEADGRTAILSGLKGDESVVLSGQFLIDSEASLKSAVSRLSATSEATPTRAADGSQERTRQMPSHLTKGRVTAIEEDRVTIAHEPVPSLQWPSMTMGFRKPSGGLPQGLKVGDEVSFSFRDAGGGTFQIESLTVLETDERAPNSPAHSPEQHQ